MKRTRIRIAWTCCDACHGCHRTLFAAWLHFAWLRITRKTRHA